MKRAMRCLSMLLCLTMALCAIPRSVYAEIADVPAEESEDHVDSEIIDAEIYVLGEMTDLRTETSKTFRMSDGSYVLTDYAQAVHYQDGKGNWFNYDNTLASSSATADEDDFAGVENTSSDVRVKFANNSNSSNLVKITFGDYKISLHLVDAAKSKAAAIRQPIGDVEQDGSIEQAATLGKFTSGVIYQEILSDTDLEYFLSGGTVKENIIVKERQDKYSYTFEWKLHGLVPAVTEKGDIALNDEKTGETVLTIPAGYMFDANGETSDAVTYSIAPKNGKKYTLTVTADAEWMNTDARVFPVTIDPSVEVFQGIETTGDTYIAKNAPTKNYYLEKTMAVGYYNGSAEQNALLEPLALPALPASATVTSATMYLFQTDAGGTYVTLAASAIQSDWDSTKVTWNTKPSYSEEILDYQLLRPDTAGKWINWDITRLVQDWYSGVTTCRGVALYPISGEAGAYVHLASSEYGTAEQRPMLIVSYHDTKGLEGIWQYAAQSAGSAGTSYVNGFNGNLVFVHDDMTTQGSILPIAVSHVYNQYQINSEISDAMKVGKGWKLSVQETVKQKNLDGVTWYVYTDADGTELYFYKDPNASNAYISEDGYGLTLTVGSTYTMTDDYGNTKTFNAAGNISEIRDVLGNKKTFVYTSNRLTSITYTPAGDSTVTTQLTFTYNASGALSRITNAYDTSDYVDFYYSATYSGSSSTSYSGYLRRISYSKGGSCTYRYESDGSLRDAQDEDALKYMRYTYNRTSYTDASGETRTVQRVASVVEFAIHAEYGALNGQQVRFLYGNKKFTVCSRGKDDIADSGDDIYTTYLFDNYGRTICSYSTDETQTEVYGAAYAAYTETTQGSKQNNKITVDSVKGLTAANLLLNGNAESLTNWNGATSGSGYSSSYSDADKFFGNGSLQFTAATSATSTGYARRYQTVTIPSAGTYTLSAYVKTSNVKALTSNGGAYLIFGGTESEKLTGTTNTGIQNGWQRISVTKTFSSPGSYQVQLRLGGATGTAYFDCIQLEKSEVPSGYNLIENGDISLSSGWSLQATSSDSWRGRVLCLEGSAKLYNHSVQTVHLNIPKNTTLMLSGWGKASATPSGIDSAGRYRTFSIVATATYTDGTRGEWKAEFNPDYADWQYSAVAIVPENDVKSISVSLQYDYNLGMAYFDDICLTVEPAQTYQYNDNGNMVLLTDENGQKNKMVYAANGVDLANFTNTFGETYEYSYKTANNTDTHLVSKITKTSAENTQTLEYDYDAYGNVTSSKLTASGTTEQVKSTATYSSYGNYLSTVTDSMGNTTGYGYLNDLLSYVTNANQNRTAYEYDSRKRMTTVYLDSDQDGAVDSGEAAVYYAYLQNRLSGISTATTSYTLSYDLYGNIETVKAGANTLASYRYAGENGKLASMTLGNGDKEEYFYDLLDRLVEVRYNGSTTYKLTYDANGRLYRCVDSKSGITHQYEYDSLGRLIRAWQKNTSTGETLLAVENTYDEYGRATGSTYVVDGKTKQQGVKYKEYSNLVSYVDWDHFDSTPQITYQYDAFDRLISKSVNSRYIPGIRIDYTYKTRTSGGATYTATLVSEEKMYTARGLAATYKYIYDALGNITEIQKDGTLLNLYLYDSLNRLVQEYNAETGISYSYTYDDAGNILSKKQGTATTTYTYSASAWGDLLTNYAGTTISYDEIGNPLNWRDGVDLTWNGRQLVKGTISSNVWMQYNYNADGIRTVKSYVNSGTHIRKDHNYLLDGTKILKETIKTSTITTTDTQEYDYFYDEKGEVAGFEYNGNAYFYQKNIQGDVLRICDEGGRIVAEYTYDTWGKVLSVTDGNGNAITSATHVANLNPFRYRSYYYDTETGLYYLNSRYYDPEVGRFINADAFVSTGQDIVGYNMFAYCGNNPIVYKDPSGNLASYFQKDSLNDLIMASLGGGGSGVCGHLPSSKEYEEALYDSNRNKTHIGSFRESLFGISGNTLGLALDDDKNINFNLMDFGIYGYKAGWYFDNFELEGIAGSVSANASIGTDGLFSAAAQASASSGSISIRFGPLEIRLEGYFGGIGGSFSLFSDNGTGISLMAGLGGGIFFKWH